MHTPVNSLTTIAIHTTPLDGKHRTMKTSVDLECYSILIPNIGLCRVPGWIKLHSNKIVLLSQFSHSKLLTDTSLQAIENSLELGGSDGHGL